MVTLVACEVAIAGIGLELARAQRRQACRAGSRSQVTAAKYLTGTLKPVGGDF